MTDTENQFQAMADEIGRLKVEALAQSQGAIDAKKVYEVVNKSVKAEIDAAGIVKLIPVDERGEKLRTASGEYMTVDQYIGQLKASPEHGHLFVDGASRPKVGGGITTEENPWLAATWNLTAQGAILRRDKVYGERLKAAAGGSVASGNPFVEGPGHNLSRQAAILKENPSLGEQLKRDALPGESNPWIHPQNLTLIVYTMRSDPTKAARLKAEARIANEANGHGPKRPEDYLSKPRFPVTRPKGWAGR